jgi:uncharacterized protein DUF4384
MLALLLVLAQSPVTVQLNHDQFTSGDHARVYVQSAQDGHLVVLHADPDGRIRVLFPLDPRDDDFIRGGRKFELRGRADRDAFQVEGDEGSGTVLAAVSPDPLSYDAFVHNDHWDFRALGGPSSTVRDDPLAKLLDIVQRMSGDSSGRFNYDVTTYVVRANRLASAYGYGYGSGWDYPYHFGVGFYNPFCGDPFWGWANCFGYGFGYPFGFGYRISIGYRFGWGFPYTRFRPYPPLVFSRLQPRVRYEPVPVRPRVGLSPSPIRTRDFAPRIFSRPLPRASGGGWSRPAMPRGGSGSSGRSFGGGRRH